MATKKECDQYAAELNDRFDALTRWAIGNWPNKNFPLLMSDFSASRREIGSIIGPKLGDGDPEPNGSGHSAKSYISVAPMPCP